MSKSEKFYEAYLSHRHISRRGLFRAFLTAAREVAPTAVSSQPSHPLPPGALPVAEFVTHCTQCHACTDSCPMGVLTKHESGLPQLAIEFASCDGCASCIEACPTGALQPQIRFDTGLRPAFTRSCVNGIRSCNQCVEACPVNACSIEETHMPVVDSALCNGCGECVIQCTHSAILLQ
ncbi:4Fe-4S binding protein [uncultured Cedecea sp.]|uniref:4Fe-4S binding protein n=1 Tax=uncultured Cedecea sp. TaxID=988762 RepID=UPI002612429A|nr:4Fe-4S binding protein [uncultured Cedecea sp.]